ncbi:S49 family peptidase [Sphingomonas sp. RIT328]|uniref:S49 family peptidase n=1 Tax=Sphingomonas sp. RIT328 TaxID=1470591 RepID=UPI000446B808|nr:S49 family peptidase [Sphingomonas sp. RIT328]EZP57250.1 Peptidase S49 family protein [Sphingomonas sp. RIT328]
MDRFLAASALWAMHPAFLESMLKSGSIDAMLPDSLRQLASAMGGQQAAKPADPIRDGSTQIIPVRGTLAPQGLYGTTYYNVLADQVREAAADNKIGAIVLAIRSPGGYVWGCAEAGDAIFEARSAKPVIAVADPYCFSAAYWLATQASAFYCTTSGEVGSVGVRSGHTDMSGFESKIGMVTTLIASHPDKIAAHPYGALSDEDRADIQAGVDESNAAFAAAIARGRGMKAGDVAAVHGTGKTFSSRRALANGAIDGVSTLRDVVAQYNSSRARLSLMRRQAEAMAQAI